MTTDRLRALYALILTRGARPRAVARLSVERILALVERRGGDTDRLRTLDTVMADREYVAELEILQAAIGVRRTMRRGLAWSLGTLGMAAAATVLLAVGVTAVAKNWSTRSDTLRGANGPVVQLIAPSERVGARGIQFSWKPVLGARDYEIEVLDADGLSTFVSTVQGTTVLLPATVQLLPGTEYRWWVVARRADGSRVGPIRRRLRVDDPGNGSGADANRVGAAQPHAMLARVAGTSIEGRSLNTPTQARS